MRISQREARRLRKRVDELERAEDHKRRAWANDWPGGTSIAGGVFSTEVSTAIHTARRLKHAVVVTIDSENRINFLALPLAK